MSRRMDSRLEAGYMRYFGQEIGLRLRNWNNARWNDIEEMRGVGYLMNNRLRKEMYSSESDYIASVELSTAQISTSG